MNASRILPTAAVLFAPDGSLAERLGAALGRDFALTAVTDPEALRRCLREQDIALAFVAEGDDAAAARAVLGEVARSWPETVRIGLCTEAEPAIFAMEAAGAELVLSAEAPATALRLTARHARRLFRLRREHDRQRAELSLRTGRAPRRAMPNADPLPLGQDGFARIIRAPGSPMAAVCATAARLASFDVPALILGETGTGKELVARAMHGVSRRADRPFLALNCGAIPDQLLEAELFGHRRGAFTGAHADRIGLLEQADHGTVFLDEIAETSPAFQVKLLRFLQEGEIRPVGANETVTVDVRVIAACNRPLACDAGPNGLLRADLYWRLAVAPLQVPPLRERRADLPLIVEALLDRAIEQHGKHVDGVTPEAMAALAGWHWPGNIRELENEITRMLVMAMGHKLGADLVAPRILRSAPGDADITADEIAGATGTLRDRVEQLEARVLRETLTRLRGNKSRAADELGLSRVGLRAKLDRYGLGRESTPLRAAE